MNNQLSVYFEETLVGFLWETTLSSLEFQYDRSWLEKSWSFSISYSMPLNERVYTKEAHNFFTNLLPEGEVRIATARALGVSVENDFKLLEALGGECAGALSIGHTSQTLESRYRPLMSDKNLLEKFKQGVTLFSYIQQESEEIRLSLAGAQDKVPVIYQEGKLFLPQGNSPSSHILKLPSLRFKYLPENEYLMIAFTKNLGLKTIQAELIDIDGVNFFLCERYDRFMKGDQRARLPQEDFCQALSYSYKTKYELEGGPSFKICSEALENRSMLLPEDIESLVKWLIVNVVIGNCDAHAKNISFLMEGYDTWILAPFYDLVCTKAYPTISTKMAMGIGGAFDSGTVTGTHWKRLAEDIHIGSKWLLQQVEEIAENSLKVFEATQESFAHKYGESPILDISHKVIHEQRRRLLSQLKK